jgi:hypothetical protein
LKKELRKGMREEMKKEFRKVVKIRRKELKVRKG